MKSIAFLFFIGVFAVATSSILAVDAVPEPGLIIYGQVYSLNSPSSTVAIGSITWNNNPGGTGTAVTTSNYGSSLPQTVPSDSTGSFYIARVPFETVNPFGLTLDGSDFFDLLSTTPDPHQLGFRITPLGSATVKTAQVKAPGNPTFYNWSDITANAGAQKRGSVVRVDLLVDALPSDPFSVWMAGFLPGGGPNAARTADPDHDGMTNEQEFLAGTHPLDPMSLLQAWFTPSANTANVTITWQSVAGKKYQLQKSLDLQPGNPSWLSEGAVFTASGNLSSQSAALPAGVNRSFYRVSVVP